MNPQTEKNFNQFLTEVINRVETYKWLIDDLNSSSGNIKNNDIIKYIKSLNNTKLKLHKIIADSFTNRDIPDSNGFQQAMDYCKSIQITTKYIRKKHFEIDTETYTYTFMEKYKEIINTLKYCKVNMWEIIQLLK
jgi:hypothetical protein